MGELINTEADSDAIPKLVGKTVVEAIYSKTPTGDEELFIKCSDGSSFGVNARQMVVTLLS